MNKSVSPNRPSFPLLLLLELRSRLIYSFIFLLLLFAVLLYFANHLYTWLALPLLRFLPQGHLIATQIVSPFFVPVKLAFMASLFLGAPFFLYQGWAFVAPAALSRFRTAGDCLDALAWRERGARLAVAWPVLCHQSEYWRI